MSTLAKMYEAYEKDPTSFSPSWQSFFSGVDLASFELAEIEGENFQIYALIEAYRRWGHLLAQFHPLSPKEKKIPWQLDITTYGFHATDLKKLFPTLGLLSTPTAPLGEILQALKDIYTGKIGFEYLHVPEKEIINFIQKKIESSSFSFSKEEKKKIFTSLMRAELFEIFLHKHFPGQKRFSLEGMESLMPILHLLLQDFPNLGIQQCLLGMAHRGRLNVLANFLQKPFSQLFSEFEGYYPSLKEGGDVKYHKGFSSEVATSEGEKIKVSLCNNPSHLESVYSVLLGQTRAKQDAISHKKEIFPIVIHGDASVAGQGVVYECLQMMRLEGYTVAGALHIILDNQIGFTASSKEGRSTLYPSDIAKGFGSPVFHVNVENPEGCVFVSLLAMQLRQQFGCDVWIHLNGYRKYGHNEGDEPTFTQPLEYQSIQKKSSVYRLYTQHLFSQGEIEKKEVEKEEKNFQSFLSQELEIAKAFSNKKIEESLPEEKREEKTSLPLEELTKAAKAYLSIPSSFHIHPKLQKAIEEKKALLEEEQALLDWAFAEILAFSTLLQEGVGIRLSGQDAGRGTFNQRHVFWVDQTNGTVYSPLAAFYKDKAPFYVYNSFLSEFAALGFEFGYTLAEPNRLTLWEAQFGDFSNGAQIIIDQYLSASFQKWGEDSSLVLLLPHGYEGQGPEHSSARMERFLQLCSQDNWRVVYPSTPAQYFHILRRQAKEKKKRPLIILTPKSLLRHPLCKSNWKDFTQVDFLPILEEKKTQEKKVQRIVFCTGKIYYDLLAEKEKHPDFPLTILRIEQLYPVWVEGLQKIAEKYKDVKECFWVQEEPENMGAWKHLYPFLRMVFPSLEYIGRKKSASPATGSSRQHKLEQQAILDKVFA